MNHTLKLFRIFCSYLSLILFGSVLTGATVNPFGPPFPESIEAVAIPPTRAENPYVATANEIFRWDDNQQLWQEIYSPPWNGVRILALGTYYKSSKVIYAVHSSGISRSGDGGLTWSESVPIGFDGSVGEFHIKVDPNERKHAVIASKNKLWETTDYGASFQAMQIDDRFGDIKALEFLPGRDSASLILVQEEGITLHEGESLYALNTWTSEESIESMAIHPVEPIAILRLFSGKHRLIYLQQGDQLKTRILPVNVSTDQIQLVAAGSSSLWAASGDSLNLLSLTGDSTKSFTVAELSTSPDAIFLHPRKSDSLYIVEGSQLSRVDGAFEGAFSSIIQPGDWGSLPIMNWDAARPQPSEPEVTESAIPGEQPMDAAILLSRVLAGEPGFQETLRKVLEFEQAKPGEFAEWMQKVRSRHLLPELKIIGGFREYGVTDNLLVTGTDAFGFETLEDYRLPDQLRNLSYFGIILEWPLEGLIYDDEMVDISRERRYYFQERREMIETLSELYYGRINRILEAKGLMGKPSQAKQLQLLLEINKMSEILNGFCGEILFSPMPLSN
jgi:hypothetical protein